MKKIFHITNQIRGGAIPHIVRDLHPHMDKYEVHLVALQNIVRTDKIAQELEQLGVVLHELKASQYDLIGSLLKLRKFFRIHNPDIVHAHLGRPEILCPFAVGRNCILFSTTHSVKLNYNIVARAILPLTQGYYCKRFFVSNEAMKTWGGESMDNSEILYNPIRQDGFADISLGAPKNINSNDLDKFNFLNVGRLTTAKAQADILEASFLLKQRVGSIFRLKIAGRGPLERSLVDLRNKLSLIDEVQFLGFQDDVRGLFSDADCFVFSSRWEGFGLAMLEAIAAGLPVIRSDIPVLDEVAPSDLVLSYPVGDIQLLSERMFDAIVDQEACRSLAIDAQIWSLKFSAKHIARQLQDHYDRALGVEMPSSNEPGIR